ncbi:MAG TPA: DUF4397 domain-containing protein [Terriglobales bacterium]|jgi:hypothetical protein|nr:DUF4397 domain-containing protein [Terriglobales bacterium]
MSRLLKPLPLTVAIAILTIITAGCATNSAKGRFLNALQNTNAYGGGNGAIDVYINQTKIFSNLSFATPSSTYMNIATGNDTFEGYESSSNDTVPVFNNLTANLTGGDQYTLIAAGLSGGSGAFAPQLIYQHDENVVPAANKLEFRVINASPNSPTSVDVWIIPEPTTGPEGTCVSQATGNCPISGLTYASPTNVSPYLTFTAVQGGNFGLFVTFHNSTSLIAETTLPGSSGSITTIVLVDKANGSFMSPTPVILQDLQ